MPGGLMSTAGKSMEAAQQGMAQAASNVSNTNSQGFLVTSTSFSAAVSATGTVCGVSSTTMNRFENRGTMKQTGNELDLCMSSGFMPACNSKSGEGTIHYVPSVEGVVDAEGYLRAGGLDGLYMMGIELEGDGVLPAGGLTLSALVPVKIEKGSMTADPTTTVRSGGNLPIGSAQNDAFRSTVIVYDGQGGQHELNLVFTAGAVGSNRWTVTVDMLAAVGAVTGGTIFSNPVDLEFHPNGTLSRVNGADPGPLALSIDWAPGPGVGAAQQTTMMVDLVRMTQMNSPFTTFMSQDGSAPASYTGCTIAQDGTIKEQYGRAGAKSKYKLPLINFPCVDGLKAAERGSYVETEASGMPQVYEPGSSGMPAITSGHILESAVNRVAELGTLVDLGVANSIAAGVAHLGKKAEEEVANILHH